MSYEDNDDLTIEDGVVLWRKIKPDWVVDDDNGNKILSSMAFQNATLKKHNEMMVPAGYKHSPALSIAFANKTNTGEYLKNTPGYYLVEFTAGEVRKLNQTVQETPLEDEPAHGSVIGKKKSQTVKKGFKAISKWVVGPT